MTGAEVLARFQELGVPLRLAEDGTIRLPVDAAAEHPELLDELRAHREEAVRLLDGGHKWTPEKGAATGQHGTPEKGAEAAHPCVDCGAEGGPERLLCPSCEAARATRKAVAGTPGRGAWIVVRSRRLGRDVLLGPAEGDPPPALAGLPRYTWDEVERIVRGCSRPGLLEELHRMKTIFPGAVVQEVS